MKPYAWLRFARLLISLSGAALLLMLILVSAGLASAPASAWSDPPRDPEIGAITLTSELVYDPAPGTLTRTVYFNNKRDGIITVTVALTGTPTLTLTGSAAFSNTVETVLTSTLAPFIGVVTYQVGTQHDTQPVWFTATNTHSLSAAVPITFVRDVTAPRGEIVQPVEGWVAVTPTLYVTGTAADAGAGIERVQVVTGVNGLAQVATYSPFAQTWSYTWTMPAEDGVAHRLLITITDFVGNVFTATRAITVDNVAPGGTVLFTSSLPVNQWVNAPALDVQWTGFTDGGAIAAYQYLLTNTSPVSLPLTGGVFTTATHVTQTLDEGHWYFHVAAHDVAGNWSVTQFAGPFLADKTPPTSVISSPVAGAVLTIAAGSPYSITGAANDTGGSGLQVVTVTVNSNVLCTRSAAPWECAWPITGVDSTTFTLQSRARDNAGNLQVAPYSVNVRVDTVAPAAAVPAVAGAPWSPTTTLTFTWPASSDAAGIGQYELRITDTTASLPHTIVTTATHYISPTATEGHMYQAALRAMDRNGNVGMWSSPSVVITPDLTNPIVSYGAPPIPLATGSVYVVGTSFYYTSSNLNSATIQVTATDNLSLTQVTASPAPSGWYGPIAVPMTPPTWRFLYGQNNVNVNPSGVLTVTGQDAAGRTATRIFTYTFDNAPPAAVIVNAPTYFSATTGSIAVTCLATDTLSGIKQVQAYYRRDGEGWTPGPLKSYSLYARTVSDTLSVPVSSLPGDGRYEWRAVAADNLNNTPGAPVGEGDRVTFYDTTPPTATVEAPLVAGDAPITLSWTVSDATAGVSAAVLWVKPPGGVWSRTLYSDTSGAVSGTFAYVPTAGDGIYYFYVRAVDLAGNAMPEPTAAQAQTVYGSAPPDTQAWVPGLYANYTPITVTWRATSTAANLQAVTLCVSTTLTGWQATSYVYSGTMTNTASGQFFYAPAEDGRYYFAAETEAGKKRNCPTSGPGSTSILYDTYITAPVTLAITPSRWSRVKAFTVTWSKPSDLSGIKGAYYAIGVPPTHNRDGTFVFALNFAVTAPGQGRHPVYLWLEDNAGNIHYPFSRTVDLRFDSEPPSTPVITAPARSASPTFNVAWWSHDATSGVISYTLEYSSSKQAGWQLATSGPTTQTQWTAPFTDTLYTLRVTAYDAAGNSAQATRTIYVGRFKLFLPMTLRDYPPRWQAGSGMSENTKVYALAACTGIFSKTVYVGTLDHGVYKSTDAGKTWLSTGDPMTVYGIAAAASCTTVYAATFGQGVYKSTDGSTWNIASEGLTGFALYVYGITLNPSNNNEIYIGTANGVYKSTDAGHNWTQQGLGSLYIFGVSVDPQQPQTIYAATYNNGVYKSTDGGASWTPAGLSGTTVYIVLVDPRNSQHLLAATMNGLQRSTNGGQTWAQVGPATKALWVTADRYHNQFLVGYDGQGVWRSADGQTWTALDYGLSGAARTVNVVETGEQYLYAGTNDRVWRYPRTP